MCVLCVVFSMRMLLGAVVSSWAGWRCYQFIIHYLVFLILGYRRILNIITHLDQQLYLDALVIHQCFVWISLSIAMVLYTTVQIVVGNYVS